MPRPLWNGVIGFGLVTIPVSLYPATTAEGDIRFKLLHASDMRPIHNRRTDDLEHDVPWEDVVRAYEHEPGEYVVITDEELKAANVEATRSIDIIHFVDAAEIDPVFYDTPYYIEPAKPARKAYALLRETLDRSGLVGIARIVIRTRQHLCALRTAGPALVVQTLRWPYQIAGSAELRLPETGLRGIDVSDAELAMAEQLVGSMRAAWNPSSYRDSYRDDVRALIEEKVRTGIVSAAVERTAAHAETGEVVDIMTLLKRSVERQRQTSAGEAAKRRTSG